jgi:hypothetical protein
MQFNPLVAALLVSSLIGAVFLLTGLHALKKLQLFRAFRHLVITLLCLSITAASGILLVANHGYRELVAEQLAATVSVSPDGKQRFTALLALPDGTRDTFALSGDQVYIDAHILKWNPLLNVIGIRTMYELDRIGGRYADIGDEQSKPRTIYPLSKNRILNMYVLRRRFTFLRPLLDARYGSAAFVPAGSKATFSITVSASGLVAREAQPDGKLER